MKQGFDFKPPLESSTGVWLANVLSECARKWRKVTCVEVSPEDRQRLEELSGQRVILAPNHPTEDEPAVVWKLSRQLGVPLNYMVSRHLFDLFGGALGWVLQRAGCYSVLRASGDRHAIRATRKLLAAGKRWLVVFPEGETGGHNDLVLPFHTGVVQMGFWTVADMTRAGEQAPVNIVPVAIKYVYLRDMRPAIGQALARIERGLGLSGDVGEATPYARLRRIGDRVLSCLERSYGVQVAKDAGDDDMNTRIDALRDHILASVAGALGVETRADEPFPDRMRVVFNALDAARYAPPETGSAYEERLWAERQDNANALFDDILRVRRFMVVSDGYVRQLASAERFLETTALFEEEVLGRSRVYGPRKAVVRVGEPIDLLSRMEEYKRDKRGTVAAVTEELQSRIEAMLEAMSALTPSLPDLGGAGPADEAGSNEHP